MSAKIAPLRTYAHHDLIKHFKTHNQDPEKYGICRGSKAQFHFKRYHQRTRFLAYSRQTGISITPCIAYESFVK